MRDVEHGKGERMMAHIHHWDFSVGALTDEVINSASNSGFVLNLGYLDGVRSWKDATVDEFKYYVSEQVQIKLPKGRLAGLLKGLGGGLDRIYARPKDDAVGTRRYQLPYMYVRRIPQFLPLLHTCSWLRWNGRRRVI
jgi:hypothetical protein